MPCLKALKSASTVSCRVTCARGPRPALIEDGEAAGSLERRNSGQRGRRCALGSLTARRISRLWSAGSLRSGPSSRNLKFDFNCERHPTIRITFHDNDGAWSYIGPDCKNIPLEPTDHEPRLAGRGVVLHEFGHAIGLDPRASESAGGIKWNKPNVYRDLGGPPNRWDPKRSIATCSKPMIPTR